MWKNRPKCLKLDRFNKKNSKIDPYNGILTLISEGKLLHKSMKWFGTLEIDPYNGMTLISGDPYNGIPLYFLWLTILLSINIFMTSYIEREWQPLNIIIIIVPYIVSNIYLETDTMQLMGK